MSHAAEEGFWRNRFKDWEHEDFTDKYILAIRRRFPFHKGISRLFIGCGPTTAFHIKDMSIIGVDVLNDKFRAIGYSDWFTRVTAPSQKLPFKDKEFKYVYALNMLDHMEESKAIETVKEVHRVLKDDGIFYLYVDMHTKDSSLHRMIDGAIDMLESLFDTSKLGQIDKFTTDATTKYSLCGELTKKV